MRILLLLLCSTALWGQRVDFKGLVVDQATKEPVPFVNLSFLNTLVGTSTDEAGNFLLEIPEKMLDHQVHVSALAYKDTIVAAKTIMAQKQLPLRPETFELREVEVAVDLGGVQIMNPINSKDITSGFDASSTPWVLALYFPNIGASTKYLEQITVFFRDNARFRRKNAKFRLRLYHVDPKTKKPTTDILQKSLVLRSVKGSGYTTIDLSAFKLKMPRQGVYVGLEWLFIPYNWYKAKDTDPLSNKPRIEDRFAPTFGGVYTKNSNIKLMVYGMGQWQDFKVRAKNNREFFVPAISVKISQDLK